MSPRSTRPSTSAAATVYGSENFASYDVRGRTFGSRGSSTIGTDAGGTVSRHVLDVGGVDAVGDQGEPGLDRGVGEVTGRIRLDRDTQRLPPLAEVRELRGDIGPSVLRQQRPEQSETPLDHGGRAAQAGCRELRGHDPGVCRPAA